MVRIRLRRVGKRKQPQYRVVVADARTKRDGRFIEIIGQYNPLTEPSQISIDNDKALDWLRKGAQPSEQVKSLLKRTGIWSEFVKDKGPAKRPPKPKRKAAPPTKADAEASPKAEAKPAPKAEAKSAPKAPEAAGDAEEPAQEPATEPETAAAPTEPETA